MSYPNLIVLTGFMGTGKSSVGRALARTIGYSFIDSDREIESREGRTIHMIFESEGEKYFRNLERETIARLSQNSKCVLSIGGGAILDPETFERIHQAGTVILLKAEVSEIVGRLGHENERPLLAGKDRKKTIQKLVKEREPVYSKVGIQIDTTGLAVDEVVQKILKKI